MLNALAMKSLHVPNPKPDWIKVCAIAQVTQSSNPFYNTTYKLVRIDNGAIFYKWYHDTDKQFLAPNCASTDDATHILADCIEPGDVFVRYLK